MTARVFERLEPSAWGLDELLTLDDARQLFRPSGPLSTKTLRTAIREGTLDHLRIAGKV